MAEKPKGANPKRVKSEAKRAIQASKASAPGQGSPVVITAKRPKAFLHRDIQIDAKKLFSGLVKCSLNLTTGGLVNLFVAKDIIQGLGGFIGFKDDVSLDGILSLKQETLEERAGALLLRATAQAVMEVIQRAGKGGFAASEKDEEVVGKVVRALERICPEEYELSMDFFRRSERSTLVTEGVPKLESLLKELGIGIGADAGMAAEHFGRAFIRALDDALRIAPDELKGIVELINRPTAGPEDWARQWDAYVDHMDRSFRRHPLWEPFGLDEVYLPPRGWYEIAKEGDKSRKAEEEGERGVQAGGRWPRRLFWLAEHLDGWLAAPEKSGDVESHILAIAGEPGIGKSTFARWYAAEVNNRRRQGLPAGLKVLSVPFHRLRNLNHAGSLRDILRNYFDESKLLTKEAFDAAWDGPLLVILDGLDEVEIHGGSAREVLDNFLMQMIIEVHNINTKSPSVRVIVMGRVLAVREHAGHFSRVGQLIRMVPFTLPPEMRSKRKADEWIASLLESTPLDVDQREDWWAKFHEILGLPVPEEDGPIPAIFQSNREWIGDLMQMPLLNALLAWIWRSSREDLVGKLIQNRNSIFRHIIDKVWSRSYDSGAALLGARNLSLEDFCRVLEEMATVMWHHEEDGLRIARGDVIAKHFEKIGLLDDLKIFSKMGKKEATTKLMIMFYIREAKVDFDDTSYEFIHKSFVEYFLGRRIARMMQEIASSNWGGTEAKDHLLDRWARLTGPAELDEEVVRFWLEEMDQTADHGQFEAWFECLDNLFFHQWNKGCPIPIGSDGTRTIERYSRNAEEALFIARAYCAKRCEKEALFGGNAPYGPRYLLSRLQSRSQQLTLVNAYLGPLMLEGADLRGIDLRGADLQRANLRGADLQRANLQDAYLGGAELWGGNLQWADLQGADLQGTGLGGAELQGADLRGAKLQGADLQDAILVGANLVGANLLGANLVGAVLKGANLRWGFLAGVDLQETNLDGADLRRAVLQGADLRWALLRRADLRGADLLGVELKEANLSGAFLSKADLERANLDGVDLSGVNLKEDDPDEKVLDEDIPF